MNYWDGENWLEVKKDDISIRYYLNGELHRKDGPAEIWRNKHSGYIRAKYYYLNGKLHRENGPAEIWYYANGNIKLEQYYYNDKKHNINGPSFIIYYEDSNIKLQRYYFNGIKFNPDNLPFKFPIDTEEKRFMFQLKYGI